MSMYQMISPATVFDAQVDRELVRKFLHDHGAALAWAAYRLGEGTASGQVFTLIDSLANSRRPTRLQCRRLSALHRLLTLQRVGEPERIGTGLFVGLNPTARIVDEICLLSEQLEQLLYQISADEEVDSETFFRETA